MLFPCQYTCCVVVFNKAFVTYHATCLDSQHLTNYLSAVCHSKCCMPESSLALAHNLSLV